MIHLVPRDAYTIGVGALNDHALASECEYVRGVDGLRHVCVTYAEPCDAIYVYS